MEVKWAQVISLEKAKRHQEDLLREKDRALLELQNEVESLRVQVSVGYQFPASVINFQRRYGTIEFRCYHFPTVPDDLGSFPLCFRAVLRSNKKLEIALSGSTRDSEFFWANKS